MSEPSFEQRLERLILEPESIRGAWLGLMAPLWRLLDFQPKLTTQHLARYVHHVSASEVLPQNLDELERAALREFDQNLSALERAQYAHGRVEPRLLNWAVRLHAVLERTRELKGALQKGDASKTRARAAKRALQGVAHRGLKPLEATREASAAERRRLSSIEALLDAAENERDFLGRRRQLLEAARELLVDSASKVVNRSAVEARLEQVAREMGELDRLLALGVQPDKSLLHQLGAARAERSVQRLNGILATLESQALQAGDGPVAELSQAALEQLWGQTDRFAPEARHRSLVLSGEQTFQLEVLEAARQGLARARDAYESERLLDGRPRHGDHFDGMARAYLNDAAETELIQAALYVDGCVDVGGVLSPHRVHEVTRVVREVRHPTQQLTLAPAREVDDLRDAIVSDPRTILSDLATERLLVRRYLGQETRTVERRVLASEVRIFLLDGSGSMLGPRARMRDAILVAELSTMIARLGDRDRWLTPTLYYRYFNDKLGEVVEVSTASQAVEAVERVLGELRHGGTNIEGALLGSFETLRAARAKGGETPLARAQIVLITDGEAPVDQRAVEQAREGLGDLPIGVSIIALGEENPALRALAERQRQRGERVFYQFLNDAMLARLARGEALSLSMHLPDELATVAPTEALAAVLDELESLQRGRDDEALSRARDERAALQEVGLSLTDLSKTEQARFLSLSRERKTLDERFSRWFPTPATPAPKGRLGLRASARDEEAIVETRGLLGAVAEVTELVGGTAERRKLDAIEMFERLLMERRSSFLHYQKLLERHPRAFDAELEAIHRAADEVNRAE